jgi:hypothetical protein
MSPHWRSLTDSDWLHAGDLLDPKTGKYKEYTLEIASVTQGLLVGEGGKKSRKPAIRFKGARKPYGAGATVCKTISDIAGSPLFERWVGVRVTLYVTQTKAKGGELTDCIRVRPKAPPMSRANDEVPDDAPAFDESVSAPAIEEPTP